MKNFKKFFINLRTIRKHKKYVRKLAIKMGIPIRGLLHDLSKYSITELKMYKYATGKKSPHQTAREELGYSPSHYLHKKRNKNHPEYWYDIESLNNIIAIKMPYRYVIELVCDMVSTGKTYSGKEWKCADPYNYYLNIFSTNKLLHKDTDKLLRGLLYQLAVIGSEKQFAKWYRKNKKLIKRNYKKGLN